MKTFLAAVLYIVIAQSSFGGDAVRDCNAVKRPGRTITFTGGNVSPSFRFKATAFGVPTLFTSKPCLNPVHPSVLPIGYSLETGAGQEIEVAASVDVRGSAYLRLSSDFELLLEGDFEFADGEGIKVVRCDDSDARALLLTPGDRLIKFAKPFDLRND